MKSVRAAVCNRMKALDLGPYDVAKLVKGKMTPQTVYNFVAGRREMNSAKLFHVLDALGLEISVAPDAFRTLKSRAKLKAAVRKRVAGVRKRV